MLVITHKLADKQVLRTSAATAARNILESEYRSFMTAYPDDADGAVLAELAAQGVDMTQPLTIEFPVAVPDELSARNAAAAITKAGYESEIEYDEGEPDFDPATDDADEFGPSWTVYANVEMIPEYNEIIRIQDALNQITRPLGGRSDGWGVMFGGDAEA